MLKMSFVIFLIAFLPIITSCASLSNAPDKEILSKFSEAYLVPLEDTPIAVDPTFNYILPGGGSLGYTQATGIFNIISVLVQMPEAFKRARIISEELNKYLSAREAWRPTQQLAKMAADKIKSQGITVTMAEKSLTQLGLTNLGINTWYNNNKSTLNYRALALADSSYVLEIKAGSK